MYAATPALELYQFNTAHSPCDGDCYRIYLVERWRNSVDVVDGELEHGAPVRTWDKSDGGVQWRDGCGFRVVLVVFRVDESEEGEDAGTER